MAPRTISRSVDEFRELLADLEELEASLEKRFNRQLFRRVRRLTGSQSEWADYSGVSQATIGNWERGYTVPTRSYRNGLIHACHEIKVHISDSFLERQGTFRTLIDPVIANRRLNSSILRASLTDFDFDQSKKRVVPVPFAGDFDDELVAEIAEDRANLLSSLSTQSQIIIESIGENANLNEKKIVRLFEKYKYEAESEAPNPRLLNRLGATISRTGNSDAFRGAMNDIDAESLDGFSRDHVELMRLYFKEALAQAQELDGTGIIDEPEKISGEEFSEVASIMEGAKTGSGEHFVDPSIPTLLRDIHSEIRDMNENILLSSDSRRIEIFNRRKSEAYKNGGVYVGRFVFFSALLSSLLLPGVSDIMTALSLIVGLTEGLSPGTIRSKYEHLRERFQALPALPEIDRDEKQAKNEQM